MRTSSSYAERLARDEALTRLTTVAMIIATCLVAVLGPFVIG